MDPFQIRLECLQLVRHLSASQQSILKIVDFAIKHANAASQDVWDCVLSECAKSSLNARLNILFLLDTLFVSIVDPIGYSSSASPTTDAAEDGAQATKSSSSITLAIAAASAYLAMASNDLAKIVDSVVPPDNVDAVRFNAASAQKVLHSWKRLGVFDVTALQGQIDSLQKRKGQHSAVTSSHAHSLSKNDILRRIEEDRERHKRLRERAWILPSKSFANALPTRVGPPVARMQPTSSTHLAASSSKPQAPPVQQGEVNAKAIPSEGPQHRPDALSLEFDDAWEGSSDLNEEDFEKIRQSDKQWWGGDAFRQRQIEWAERQMRQEMAVIEPVSITAGDAQDDIEQSPLKNAVGTEAGTDPTRNRWKRIGNHASGDAKRRASRSPPPARGWGDRRNEMKAHRSHHYDHPPNHRGSARRK